MILYPPFFSYLEEILMNKGLTKNVTIGSDTIHKGVQLGGHYANIVYTLLLFIFISAVTNLAAYHVQNSGQLNSDKELNKNSIRMCHNNFRFCITIYSLFHK
jgi:hypothetical protein